MMEVEPPPHPGREPITVEARFNPDGSLHPMAFEYAGRRYKDLTQGRQWEEASRHHFLVMTPGKKVFEICYWPSRAQWWLVRLPHDFSPDRQIV